MVELAYDLVQNTQVGHILAKVSQRGEHDGNHLVVFIVELVLLHRGEVQIDLSKIYIFINIQ